MGEGWRQPSPAVFIMHIRFLQTVPSENPDYPFMAGQTISTTAPSRYVLSLIDGIRAIVVKADPTERAIAPDTDTPEPTEKRKRAKQRV